MQPDTSKDTSASAGTPENEDELEASVRVLMGPPPQEISYTPSNKGKLIAPPGTGSRNRAVVVFVRSLRARQIIFFVAVLVALVLLFIMVTLAH